MRPISRATDLLLQQEYLCDTSEKSQDALSTFDIDRNLIF